MSTEHARPGDLSAFESVARAFAATLRLGDAVGLEGELGAGKTTFVSAAVRALQGASAEVTSPTFTFRQRYAGPPPVEHLDLYRLEDPREAIELGLEDAFEPTAITFVEWPERLPGLLPAHALRVRVAGAGDGPRDVTIERP